MNEEPKDYIKRIMESNGLTTKMLGVAVDVSPRTCEDWRTGRRITSKPTLKLIKQMFGE
jgi:DNA-binding transcriptional regulator YiaG